MNSQYRVLLESIQENYNNQEFLPKTATSSTLFISPSNTHQQIFLQKLINIYVLRKKQYNKINQQRISHLLKQYSGSFTDLLLQMRFMSFCMENKIEGNYERFNMLKLLTGWMDNLQKIKKDQKVNLCRSVLGMIIPENQVVSKFQQLIVYLNYIAVDLQQIIQRPSQQKQDNSQSIADINQNTKQNSDVFPSHLDPDDLIQFLNSILPKTLYNIVIPENILVNKPMASMNPQEQRQCDFLFSQQSIEYFAKQKSHYQQLLKLLFQIILKHPQLQQPLQRQLMLCVMKYLYIFNRNKHAESFSLFKKVYEKLSQAVRFALSDQFVLFFKIIRKIGHTKFIDYLRQKFTFIEDLHQKLDPNAIVGYPKDLLNAFHTLPVMESIFVNPGTMVQRFIEILQPYSLLYFYIGIKSLDLNVRFYYLGSFTSPTQKRQLLLNKEKCQIQFKGNIIALEKGIYMFEFDNTYSWMKGKGILYDALVLTPLDLVKNEVEKDKFLNVLFNKYEMNRCSDVIDVKNIGNFYMGNYQMQSNSHNEKEEEKLTVNMQYDPETQIYNLKTVGEGKIYQYQTDNQSLFNKKAHQIYGALQEAKGQSAFEWLIQGGILLTGVAMLQQWCSDPLGFVLNHQNQVEQQKQQQIKVQSEQKFQEKQAQKENQNQLPEIVNSTEKTKEIIFNQPQYPTLISETNQTIVNTVEKSQEQHQNQTALKEQATYDNKKAPQEQQKHGEENIESEKPQQQQKLQEIHIEEDKQQDQNNQYNQEEQENIKGEQNDYEEEDDY